MISGNERGLWVADRTAMERQSSLGGLICIRSELSLCRGVKQNLNILVLNHVPLEC